tara:strand:- start:128 stop:310 length:183 start_codon:yes stop_codon:yes gene_type:complete
MFKLFTKTPELPELMEYEADVFVTPIKEQVTEIPPLWEELFERMDAIEAKIDLLLDNQTF